MSAVLDDEFVYLENESTVALELRTQTFLQELRKEFENLRGLHILRIEGLERNSIISRMAYYLDNKDAAPDLSNRIREFFGTDKWLVGVANRLTLAGDYVDLIAPCRHSHVITKVKAITGRPFHSYPERDEGFLLYEAGKLSYINRPDALHIAASNGQMRRRAGARYYQGPDL